MVMGGEIVLVCVYLVLLKVYYREIGERSVVGKLWENMSWVEHVSWEVERCYLYSREHKIMWWGNVEGIRLD